ncbi:P-loop NTPase fold protein [Halobacteriovorax sp. RT-2-4]|uniref:P-loop NTPase fold protein n=1 Tax=unclassified Halobacteriovorax TaxID=2639665 RepID=UPI00399C3EF9
MNRKDFVENLEFTISNWNHEESLVLGLNGRWGEGKSTVIDFLESRLINKFEILRYTPWMWHTNNVENSVFTSFLGEFSKMLKRLDVKNLGLIEDIYAYRESLELRNNKDVVVMDTVSQIAIATAGLSSLGALLYENHSLIFCILSSVFLISLSILIFKLFSFLYSIDDSEKQKTIHCQFHDIDEKLKKLDKKIVVIIDDIDRLTENEIQVLFRMLKSSIHFSNVIYLLIYQKDEVEKALDSISGGKGKKFLKKIVQLNFDLPKVGRNRIREILFDEIELIFKRYRLNHLILDERFIYLKQLDYSSEIKNLRDVNRLLSDLSFAFDLLFKSLADDINFIDYLALNIIKTINHDLYSKIYLEKYLYTIDITLYDDIHHYKEFEDILKSHIKNKYSRELTQRLMLFLFPVFNNEKYSYTEIQNRSRNANLYNFIFVSSNFDRYFTFGLNPNEISKREIIDIIKLNKNNHHDRVCEELEYLVSSKKINELLIEITNYLKNVESNSLISLLICINKVTSELDINCNGINLLEIEMLAYDLFERIFSSNEYINIHRKYYFEKFIKEAKLSYNIMKLSFNEFDRVMNSNDNVGIKLYSESEGIKDLQLLLNNKIKHKIQTNDFNFYGSNLSKFLRFWDILELNPSMRTWLVTKLEEREFFIKLLISVSGITVTSNETYIFYNMDNLRYYFNDLTSLNNKIDLMLLVEKDDDVKKYFNAFKKYFKIYQQDNFQES